MSQELYMPISCLLNKKIADEVNEKLELVYKFAQENMISFREVPEYLSEILKNNKYASSSMKTSLSKLPDFIFKLAGLQNDSYFIKTAQEEGEEEGTSDGSDSWTRSWWASMLGFIPGVGGVISFINIWNYSFKACMNDGILSWSCCEFVFDLLVIILDAVTIAGIVAAAPTGGTSAVISGGSLAAGTVIKAMRPVLKVVMLGGKITTGIAKVLGYLGGKFIKLLEMAGVKASSAIGWFAAKKSAGGVLGKIFTNLESMFVSFKKNVTNMIDRLKKAIDDTDEFMKPLATKTPVQVLKIWQARQLNGYIILQWCSYFRQGGGWMSLVSMNTLRATGLIGKTLESVFNWFMSEGAQDIEDQVNVIENETRSNPNVVVSGEEMKMKIKSIIERNAQKLVDKLRSEGKSEAEIAKVKEFYVKYMLDIMGGAIVTENPKEGLIEPGGVSPEGRNTNKGYIGSGYGGKSFGNMSYIPSS